MSAAAIFGGVAAGGTIFSAIGQQQAAEEQAQAAEADQLVKNIQATEISERARINDAEARRQAAEFKGVQLTAFARAGVGGKSKLLLISQAQTRLKRERILAFRDASFRASQLRRGADISGQLASGTRAAGQIAAGGTLLTGFGRIGASLADGNDGQTQKLGVSG